MAVTYQDVKETNARIYRRHKPACRFFGAEDSWASLNCNCPLYGDGYVLGKRVLRKSLNTRNQAVASKKLADLMARFSTSPEPEKPVLKPIADAIAAFLASHGTIGPEGDYKGALEFSTFRKYRNVLRKLEEYCVAKKRATISEITAESLDDFRAGRHLAPITSLHELQTLRQFWGFCISRKWVTENVAKCVSGPRNLKPNEVQPYEHSEELAILGACDQFGRQPYERLRAIAMILTLRFTAMRISDVATLRKDCVRWDAEKNCWRVMVRTQKTGEPIFVVIPTELKKALDAVPVPSKAGPECPYFFWNGRTKRRAVVGIAERTLAAVFKKSEVLDAGAHRYRHTLATDLLGRGASFEDVADILGNSPAIVRRHYAKWSRARQERIDRVMLEFIQGKRDGPGTYWVQKEEEAVIN